MRAYRSATAIIKYWHYLFSNTLIAQPFLKYIWSLTWYILSTLINRHKQFFYAAKIKLMKYIAMPKMLMQSQS